MNNRIGEDKMINSFLEDLLTKGISPMSIANYRSDLNSFASWLTRKLKFLGIFTDNLSESIPFINPSTGTEYKKYLVTSNTVSSSLNRKLSTLRHLSKFLLTKGVLEFNFMEGVNNISSPVSHKLDLESITTEFRNFLEGEKVTKNTIKNYISDVKHFINWFNNNLGGFND